MDIEEIDLYAIQFYIHVMVLLSESIIINLIIKPNFMFA
jgi:hypothetical protein